MLDSCSLKYSIRFCGIFPSLKHNFIVYRSSQVSTRPDCLVEIHQLSQSVFSRVYSNSCCSCSFEPEIIKISQSSHKMYSHSILNFQVSTTILNAGTKKIWKLIEGTTYIFELEKKKMKLIRTTDVTSIPHSVYTPPVAPWLQHTT